MWLYCKQFGLHTHGLQLACCRIPEAIPGCASALPGGMRVVIWTLFGGSPGFNTPLKQERPCTRSLDRC